MVGVAARVSTGWETEVQLGVRHDEGPALG